MCDEVEGDGWWFESIRRYRYMSMFDFGLVITHIERTDRDSVCVVAHYEHLQQDDIMEVILPRKLFVPEAQEGLERDVDLKIERGALATSPIFQTKAVPNKKKLITSEEDKFGVSIYDLSSESNKGQISKLHHYSCEHFVPRFSFNGGNNILLGTTNRQPLTMIDLTTGQVTQTVNLKTKATREFNVQPEFVSKNLSAICFKNCGVIEVTDTRTGNEDIVFNGKFLELNAKDQQSWVLTSPYQNSPMTRDNSSAIKFACVSSAGEFLAYDMRNPIKPFCIGSVEKNNHQATANLAIKTTPDFSRFSVTGFDEKVNIYEINDAGTLNPIFTHDGHDSESYGTYNFVKCHLFLKKDMLLSADGLKSVQCWQFVPNRPICI